MVHLTNKLDLPAPIVEALEADDYDPGSCDYTVTQLLRPPRINELVRRHAEEIEEDASDRIYALMGQAIHKILEEANCSDFGEERLYMNLADHTIGGRPDHFGFDRGVLSDYKMASVWEMILGVKAEREQQLNIYAELFRQNGYAVSKLQNVFFFRDWSKSKAARESDYPQRQVAVIEQPLWPGADVRDFIADRIRLHESAKIDLPECTPEERWARDPVYAVMRGTAKKALRLLKTKPEAEVWLKDNAPTARIEFRAGESIRCANGYCAAAPFCSQWAAIQKELR